ncbi:MAG: hypothetical protein ACXVFT_04040 [Solirubrobacteraceae bacterium]
MIEGYGCPGMSPTTAGLVSMEWARADGSIGTFFGATGTTSSSTARRSGSATRASPTWCSSGRVERTARSGATSWRRAPRASRPS